MHTITNTQIIDAPIEKVWSQVKNVTLIENWHCGVSNTEKLSDNEEGVGATRRCNFYNGTEAVERVSSVTEPEANNPKNTLHNIVIDIIEFKAPMKNFSSTWELKAIEKGITQVNVYSKYDMKFSIVGQVLDHVIIRKKMPKLIDKVLAGLKEHVLTGNKIDKNFVRAL